ncbi:hypothetical protein SAMN04488117_104265 [Celeribacter baekdonensis]|uniref:Uncharacterized protein n=1 Tax=Celeribacter baekdonensis TaxID=875171 RepID=A0A1G7LFL5_9RHOB|nr:hypothetical protein [Celeribacter baekdonensis]SDF47800.1 hypothetical protein SAMN04488117_104265 [Celeribacter baekdonensis]
MLQIIATDMMRQPEVTPEVQHRRALMERKHVQAQAARAVWLSELRTWAGKLGFVSRLKAPPSIRRVAP